MQKWFQFFFHKNVRRRRIINPLNNATRTQTEKVNYEQNRNRNRNRGFSMDPNRNRRPNDGTAGRQLICQSIKHQWIKQKTTNAFKLFLYVRQPTHA